MTDREQFDEWCAIKNDSDYREGAWDGWQAACATKQAEIEKLKSELLASDAALQESRKNDAEAMRQLGLVTAERNKLLACVAMQRSLLLEVAVSGEECEFDDMTQYVMPIETFQAVSDYTQEELLSN